LEISLHGSIDLLFPSYAIEPLGRLRGEGWERVINSLVDQDPMSLERIAFVLFMVKLSGCTSCQSDSFRAMRGCVICSSNTIRRYKGNDQSLIDLFTEAIREVNCYMKEDL
jgi:hypothetical protein